MRQTLSKVPVGRLFFSLQLFNIVKGGLLARYLWEDSFFSPVVQHSEGQTLSKVPVRQTLSKVPVGRLLVGTCEIDTSFFLKGGVRLEMRCV